MMRRQLRSGLDSDSKPSVGFRIPPLTRLARARAGSEVLQEQRNPYQAGAAEEWETCKHRRVRPIGTDLQQSLVGGLNGLDAVGGSGTICHPVGDTITFGTLGTPRSSGTMPSIS